LRGLWEAACGSLLFLYKALALSSGRSRAFSNNKAHVRRWRGTKTALSEKYLDFQGKAWYTTNAK